MVALFQDQEFPGGEPWDAASNAGAPEFVKGVSSWGLKGRLTVAPHISPKEGEIWGTRQSLKGQRERFVKASSARRL